MYTPFFPLPLCLPPHNRLLSLIPTKTCSQGTSHFLSQSRLPLIYDRWTPHVRVQRHLFAHSALPSGVSYFFTNLHSKADQALYLAIERSGQRPPISLSSQRWFRRKISCLMMILRWRRQGRSQGGVSLEIALGRVNAGALKGGKRARRVREGGRGGRG